MREQFPEKIFSKLSTGRLLVKVGYLFLYMEVLSCTVCSHLPLCYWWRTVILLAYFYHSWMSDSHFVGIFLPQLNVSEFMLEYIGHALVWSFDCWMAKGSKFLSSYLSLKFSSKFSWTFSLNFEVSFGEVTQTRTHGGKTRLAKGGLCCCTSWVERVFVS